MAQLASSAVTLRLTMLIRSLGSGPSPAEWLGLARRERAWAALLLVRGLHGLEVVTGVPSNRFVLTWQVMT